MEDRKQRRRILILCVLHGIGGNAMTVFIFPFITAFLLDMGVGEHEVSTYAALAESLMSVAVFCSVTPWVWLMDNLPRRFLLLWFLGAGALLAGIFGFCNRLWQVLVVRAVMGMQSDGMVTACILGDIAHPELRAKAFGWFGSANFIGSSTALAMGGLLAQPEGRIPIIGAMRVFQEWPYALPGLALALLCGAAMFVSAVYIPETNPKFVKKQQAEARETQPLLAAPPGPAVSEPGYKEVMKNKAFAHLLSLQILNKVCSYGLLSLFSTAGHLPAHLGGVGMSAPALGKLLAVTDLAVVLTLVFGFEKIFHNMSRSGFLTLCASGWIMNALFIPLGNRLAVVGKTDSLLGISNSGLYAVGRTLGVLASSGTAVILVECFPHEGRTKAMGLAKKAGQLGAIAGTMIYGHLFSIATTKETFVGQSIATWVGLAVAILTTAVAMFQP